MSGYILRDSEPSIVLTAVQVDRLVKNGDGDAALLYLLLMRADRGVTEQELQSRLRWSQLRLNAAEGALQRLGLIQRPAETPAPAPAEERPVYSAQDLAQLLEDDRSFRMLIPQVEEKLGRRLKTADLQILAGLYDDMGMTADVIYLLVNHCIARSEERYGPGRRPTLRQIEKEGYYWARQGLFDQDSAARYLKTWRDRQQGQSAYMLHNFMLPLTKAVHRLVEHLTLCVLLDSAVNAVAVRAENIGEQQLVSIPVHFERLVD